MPKKRQRDYDSGQVKALLVGINYRGTRNQLGGCINDVLDTRKRILNEYPTAKIDLMTDDTPVKPTRDNILGKLKNLVDSARVGDTLMFHYSGHGSQVEDLHGDEEDGMDETICPLDYATSRIVLVNGVRRRVDSQITDDEIHDIISKVPRGAKFLMLADSCHSGTIADLKNDFAHYYGPDEWQDRADSAPVTAAAEQEPAPVVPLVPAKVETAIVNCNAQWTYAKYSMELWITPLTWNLYNVVGNLKLKLNEELPVPEKLVNAPNVVCNTCFEKLENNQYKISSPELGPESFVATVFSLHDRELNAEPVFPVSECFHLKNPVKYNYDAVKGRHIHICEGRKKSLNMRTINCCSGGELRLISGCEENQTSADTGTNGACTRAFWQTVQSMGGLQAFFPKLFSHHIQELRYIQDTINLNLSRFGFTQHSIISWDHAESTRLLAEAQAATIAATVVDQPEELIESSIKRSRRSATFKPKV